MKKSLEQPAKTAKAIEVTFPSLTKDQVFDLILWILLQPKKEDKDSNE